MPQLDFEDMEWLPTSRRQAKKFGRALLKEAPVFGAAPHDVDRTAELGSL